MHVGKRVIILKPKKGPLRLFGKAPELDIQEFDLQRRREIARENIS